VAQVDDHEAMTRDKFKSKKLSTERSFPHIIEIALPESGLAANVSREMARFHWSRDIRLRFGRTRTQNGQQYGRWCFSEPAVADAFRKQFGGVGLKSSP
jgi:hypothetical protein